MQVPKVHIVDYGMGNLFSIVRAITNAGGDAFVSDSAPEIQTAARLVLPGVGAFSKAMNNLKKNGLDEAITRFTETGRPLLGICLGMQLLFSMSYEFGETRGLDLIKGTVVRFDEPNKDNNYYRIPQIGWNTIHPLKEAPLISEDQKEQYWNNTVLADLPFGVYMYFVHSYYCIPESKRTVLAETQYGRNRYCSAVRKDNITGCQFHPERSGEPGLAIYKNFLFEI